MNVVRIAAPRWRHFIPIAETFTMKIPYYQAERDITGAQNVVEKYRLDYVATERLDRDYNYYQFPSHIVPSDTDSITIWYNDVQQDNGNVVLYTVESKLLGTYNVEGRRTFNYDAATNRIEFQWIVATGVNRAPLIGTAVRIEVVNKMDTANQYVYIPMKKWMIQGANPIDTEIILADEAAGGKQFQGGYRCRLLLLTKAAHGSVRIADDKLAFEYRPDMGYFGTDSFAYRVVNSMGQESEAYCVHLDIGTNLL